MDNLAVHRSNLVKERMDELSFNYIYGPAYSPDLNPIESVFSIAKNIIKRKRLAGIVNGYKVNIEQAINEAFDIIDPLKVCSFIRKSNELLFNYN